MKNEALANGQGTFVLVDRPDASPMQPADFVSAFCLVGMVVAAAAAVFVAEVSHGGWRRKRRGRRGSDEAPVWVTRR
jgi:hypothetical protein